MSVIQSIPEISAIYYALLQAGYEEYAKGKPDDLVCQLEAFRAQTAVPAFFEQVRQNTCEVYPYWPRAALLEEATFALDETRTAFARFEDYHARVMSAGNLAEGERDERFWTWVKGFPAALSEVMQSRAFQAYWAWEQGWIARQNQQHQQALAQVERVLAACAARYHSPVRTLSIVVNPIKCAWSADYFRQGERFVYLSGAFQLSAVIHEFLHPVVHPAVVARREWILHRDVQTPGVDVSYSLDGSEAGRLNAFEEYAVRRLTQAVLEDEAPESIETFFEKI